MLGAELLEVLLEKGAHGNDAIGHLLDLAEPLLVQLGVLENLAGDTSAVNRGVGVQGADEDLELGIDALLLGGVTANDGEGTDTLSVETLIHISIDPNGPDADEWIAYHVLGERLAESNLVALLNEVPDSKGVLITVTAGKALVGHVEESEVTTLLADIGDLLPLLRGRVDTSGVVCAGVKQEDAALRRSADVLDHTLEVETNCILVVVTVCLDAEAGIREDGLVVRPGRVRDEDLLVAGVETLEESGTDTESTSSGDRLGNGDAVEDRGGLAVGKLGGRGRELGDTSDAGVFLVHFCVDDSALGFADGGENVGLSGIVSVGTNTFDGVSQSVIQAMGWRDAPRLIFLSKESALKASVIPVTC